MRVNKTGEKKWRVIQVLKDAGYVNKLCHITVLYYCGSSHWRCSGLDFVTFNLVPRTFKKNALVYSRETVDVFSISAHVFLNLFWKMCSLFGQILTTYVKCYRTSFSPSCYREEMRWGRDCTTLTSLNLIS